MENSKIEWTDHTFNPWIGCTRVSPGCVHCYAETLMADRYKKVKWGPQGQRVRTSADYWKQPLKWNREAAAEGVRRRVFCASLADVFEVKADQYDDMESWRRALFSLIDMTPHLDWLILTKRPDVARVMVPAKWLQGWPVNVWIGTSVENQEYADKRIPALLQIPAAVRFLSVEPMLGPVDLTCIMDRIGLDPDGGYLNALQGFTFDGDGEYSRRIGRVSWVIVGGESGHSARPLHPDWARSIRDQCQEAGVPFLLKQWGEWIPSSHMNGQPDPGHYAWPWAKNGANGSIEGDTTLMVRVGKHRAGRLLDGREWNEFPTTDKQ